jgi:hypothetical protein
MVTKRTDVHMSDARRILVTGIKIFIVYQDRLITETIYIIHVLIMKLNKL